MHTFTHVNKQIKVAHSQDDKSMRHSIYSFCIKNKIPYVEIIKYTGGYIKVRVDSDPYFDDAQYIGKDAQKELHEQVVKLVNDGLHNGEIGKSFMCSGGLFSFVTCIKSGYGEKYAEELFKLAYDIHWDSINKRKLLD